MLLSLFLSLRCVSHILLIRFKLLRMVKIQSLLAGIGLQRFFLSMLLVFFQVELCFVRWLCPMALCLSRLHFYVIDERI